VISELSANILAVFLDAAPWLLLGLIAAGLIKAWVPDEMLTRWLGGHGIWPVTKAALIGAPLPLCSCGVLPAALGLHRGGASRSSTVSFLIATPETGADSIAVSYALLGPFMAVVRPVAAILSAIFTGLLSALVPDEKSVPEKELAETACDSCCPGSCSAPAETRGPFEKTLQGLRYAATDILDDIALWLFIGIVLAGIVATLVPPQALAEWGSGVPAMIVMLLVGIPMYICATASTPVAAALLLAGISPGTVLVFLLAGPATNIATLAVVKKELGKRVLFTYLLGIAVASIGLGLVTDFIAGNMALDISAQLGKGGELVPVWLAWMSAALLLVMSLKPLRIMLVNK
jgi:uncharacterized membrane protein YraQ (UPF0718 family)